jgi:hypothetical protein
LFLERRIARWPMWIRGGRVDERMGGQVERETARVE